MLYRKRMEQSETQIFYDRYGLNLNWIHLAQLKMGIIRFFLGIPSLILTLYWIFGMNMIFPVREGSTVIVIYFIINLIIRKICYYTFLPRGLMKEAKIIEDGKDYETVSEITVYETTILDLLPFYDIYSGAITIIRFLFISFVRNHINPTYKSQTDKNYYGDWSPIFTVSYEKYKD